MRTRPVSLDEFDDPIDLVAVQADDELINTLRAGMTVSGPASSRYGADDHVAAMLAAWKAEVDAEPIPALVDVDMAVATIQAARPSTSRRPRRHLAPVAAAAAFVVLAVGGVSVGSSGSEPGDALWGVSKVLYSERAESVEAAARVETRISTAKKALAEGRTVVATQALDAAEADLPTVRPQEGKDDLVAVQSFLVAKVDETPPGVPTDPGAPLRKDRTRTVPKGAGLSDFPKPTDPSTTAPPVAPTTGPVVVSPLSPAGPLVSPDPTPETDPSAAPTAPSSSPASPAVEPPSTSSAATTTSSPATDVSPAPTTPSQGLGGPDGSPGAGTSAAGNGTTSPVPTSS